MGGGGEAWDRYVFNASRETGKRKIVNFLTDALAGRSRARPRVRLASHTPSIVDLDDALKSAGNNGSNASDATSRGERLLPPRGDYQTLLSFQKAEVIYDITFRFAHKFLAKGDRTMDQMIQAARSGKKNILEGRKAGRVSKETEMKLTNVARASLEELLDDFKD
jgi:hypothetical protein